MGRCKDACWDEFNETVNKNGFAVLQCLCKHCNRSIPANTTKLKTHFAVCTNFKSKTIQQIPLSSSREQWMN